MVSAQSDIVSAPLMSSAVLQPTILWSQDNASERPVANSIRPSGSTTAGTSTGTTWPEAYMTTELPSVDDLLYGLIPPADSLRQSVADFANGQRESATKLEPNPTLPTPTASSSSPHLNDTATISDASTSAPLATSSAEPSASASRKPLTTINQSFANAGTSEDTVLKSKKSANWKSAQNSANDSRKGNETEDYRHLLGKTFESKKVSAQFDTGLDQATASSSRKPLRNSATPAANGGGVSHSTAVATKYSTEKSATRKNQQKSVSKGSDNDESADVHQVEENFSRIQIEKDTPLSHDRKKDIRQSDPTSADGTEADMVKAKKKSKKVKSGSTLDYDPEPVDGTEAGVPVYMIRATAERLCMFQPNSPSWLQSNRDAASRRSFYEGQIYAFQEITFTGKANLFKLTSLRRAHYLDRDRFVYGSPRTYRELILPALLLGSRVRDFEQRCATVMKVQYGEDEDIVLSMPAQNKEMNVLELKTMTGVQFPLYIADIYTGKGGKWIVSCYSSEGPLPDEVFKDAQLEVMNGGMDQPRVSEALKQACTKDLSKPIANWKLLSAIYGKRGQNESHPVEKLESTSFQYANKAKSFELNKEQQEAVARYASMTNAYPAFVVEAPPGSGKTVTAAAMALSYKGPGIQLFLSTANVPVINMVLALAKLDIGSLKVLHFISSEREEMMTEDTCSPYSALSLAKQREHLAAQILQLEEMLRYATIAEERFKLKDRIQKIIQPIFDEEYNAYFATVDMILGRLLKNGNDFVKFQLMKNVRRIVVDEASQLTEAALNALILSFPMAQIVLIGDSMQMPPYKYNKGEVISELAARSALDVSQAKMNLPVTTLKRVYRASPSLIKHYSDVFYGGVLKSCRRESPKNPLDCFGARSDGHRRLFWEVAGRQSQSGNSLVNEEEITSLIYIVHILKNSGLKQKDVMIISYYEAQRKKAEEELPEGYEVLTVDSAQGREKKVVIVLTTRSTSTDTGSFITCPLRCNVAVSRHQKALIVLGHKSITTAPNWSQILAPEYFKHVPKFNIAAENKKAKISDEW